MNALFLLGAEKGTRFEIQWEDGECILARGARVTPDGRQEAVLAVWSAAERPTPLSLARLAHEYDLRGQLEAPWALRPLELVQERGRTVLLLEDPGGKSLASVVGAAMDVGRFLRLAVSIAGALSQVHRRGLVHKDIKPAHIWVNGALDVARLSGFGLASRLPRERQVLAPPEEIAGTLAYMAPEQTGRMNRSIDVRSDLYSLGVTFYQMLTGVLPFTARDPMDWVHCHLARQPVPPAVRVPTNPAVLSDLVMKLLAKTAEERYQTAAGLEADLRCCLAAWEREEWIAPFPLGEQDRPDRLLTPERLYGREREIEILLTTFDRVVTEGTQEFVLVSGHSGIGKTSVVHELQRVLVPARGLFASGKFDQYKRDIPYATLVQVFQVLIRALLGKSEVELAPWRVALAEALDLNAGLMVPLIPELELILGPQPPVSELPPRDAQHRFQLVFRRLLGVFAQADHPLVLFLDDLQWMDAATLKLVEHLATHPEVRHLLLIGAYRNNEVKPGHPLLQRLKTIRQSGARVHEIVLSSLESDDIGRLVADALHCAPSQVEPLASLVQEKTAGNPFFAIQFLAALGEEGLLAFDQRTGWSWNPEQIQAKGFTDNVADLMLGKLGRLPLQTQGALQQLACLGNQAAIPILSIALGRSEAALEEVFWEAVRAGLVLRSEGAYGFLHDRVQEAAYALIPEGMRPGVHLAIGRRFAAGLSPELMADNVFEIVGQFNRGAALIDTAEERYRLAELNLLAGQRARAATAYASALTYLTASAAVLPDGARQRWPELAFALDLCRAECEFLTGASSAADARLADLAPRAASLPDLAAVTQMRLELFMALGQRDRAVEVGLEYLRMAGVEWSAEPTKEEVQHEYGQLWRRLDDRPIEALLTLPEMVDPVACGTMDVLTGFMQPAWYSSENLRALVICRMVNLSLEHGNSDASCLGYVWLGMILPPEFGEYALGYRFGQLGLNLAQRCARDRFKARVYQVFGGYVMPWARPIRTARSLVQHAFEVVNRFGDLTYASFARSNNLIAHLLASGESLAEVERTADSAIDFAVQARFGLVVDQVTPQRQLARTLRGLTPILGCFDDAGFDEARFEQHMEETSGCTLPRCWYWIRKLQARVLAGDHAAALIAAEKAQPLLWTSPSFFEQAEYHFYAALARAAASDATVAEEQAFNVEALATHHRQLQIWAEHCPENFENRAALVGAEIARIDGRETDAMRLYELAISSARDNDFVHNQALANELAARFYARRGFDKIARVYLQDARHGYLRWGADGKVQQLDALYPHLGEEVRTAAPTATIGASVEHLDLATVISMSQAVSGEIILDKLLDTLMRTAIEQAGAQRGVLVLLRGDEPRIAADARTQGDAVTVQLHDEAMAAGALPTSIVHYVLRTRENVVLNNAVTEAPFSGDSYIRQHNARSILCLPLLTQAKLIGVLYLENELAASVFAPRRIVVVKLLASQAAIALENNRLYRDLDQREARIRRLVEANIIGICIWHIDGRILDANNAFLRMLGYERDDILTGRLLWTELTPSEWWGQDSRLVQEFKRTKSLPPFEKEYFRKDGSRVPVLVGCASFEDTEAQGVSFVLDLTERKNAEDALQRARAELAQVTRVTSLSALTASIAHEVNQPLAAIVTNANAAVRWLARQPPDIAEARERVRRIVEDGHRAGAVIAGVRALFKKSASVTARLDMNDLIQDTTSLIQGELLRHQILLRTLLANDLPAVVGDRVQLQQVLLNLMMNGIEAMRELRERPRELLIRSTLDASGSLLVAVQDAGTGLDPQTAERVFEAFYTTKEEGLGMGLAICRLIVEAHGGQLWADVNASRGAVFQFTLPISQDAWPLPHGPEPISVDAAKPI